VEAQRREPWDRRGETRGVLGEVGRVVSGLGRVRGGTFSPNPGKG